MCQCLPTAGALPACSGEIRHSRAGGLQTTLPEYRDKGKIARQPRGSKSHFHQMLGVTGEDFLPVGDRGTWTAIEEAVHLRRNREESVTAVVQLLDQTSASIKLTNADAEENY
jgi:hypothetical protein